MKQQWVQRVLVSLAMPFSSLLMAAFSWGIDIVWNFNDTVNCKGSLLNRYGTQKKTQAIILKFSTACPMTAGLTVGAIIIWSLTDFVGLPTYKEWNCV